MSKNYNISQKAVVYCSISFLMVVLSTLSYSFLNMPILSILLACICAGLYAMATICSSSKLFYLVIPIAMISSFFISLDAFATIFSISPFILGMLTSSYVKKNGQKTELIVFGDLALLVIIVVAIVTSVYFSEGKISIQYFVDSFNNLYEEIKLGMIDTLKEAKVYDVFSKVYDMSRYTEDEFITAITDEVIFVSKAISPAVIYLLLSAISLLSVQSYIWLAKITKMDIAIPNGKWVLIPSLVSCYVFNISIVAYIISSGVFGQGNVMTVIEMTSLNLLIMLLVPLCTCGFRSMVSKLKNPSKVKQGRFILIATIILLLLNFVYGFLFMALQGATDLIFYYKKLKLWRMNNNKPE